jgi:hypothetical protein
MAYYEVLPEQQSGEAPSLDKDALKQAMMKN